MQMQFESLSPEEAALSNAKIIITTRDEAEIVRRKDVLLDTEQMTILSLRKQKFCVISWARITMIS